MHRKALAALVAASSVCLHIEVAASTFGFKNLVETIDREKITTIEALLPKLPGRLRSNFTLVHESESSQGASPENPRVLLFGDDARLLVAFNGASDHGGFQALEVIEATDLGPLEFREITFDGKKSPKVSPANPERCTGCHGVQSGYRWAGYSKWLGLYGGDDDELKDGTKLAETYDKWRAAAPKHPRYSALLFPTGEGNERFPYYKDGKFRNLDRMPNTRLTKGISRNEARARVALSSHRKWYEAARTAWAFDVLQCDEKELTNAGLLGLESSRAAARNEVPANKRGKKSAIELARLAALKDTDKHPDYAPPAQDGVDPWPALLDSAVLSEVGNSFPAVAKAYAAVGRPLESYYKSKTDFRGQEFRPAALDRRLVVVAPVERVDYSVFFGVPFGFVPESVDIEGDEAFEKRLSARRELVEVGCSALREHFDAWGRKR